MFLVVVMNVIVYMYLVVVVVCVVCFAIFVCHCFFFFFFKQKTAYEMRISDWSSDVCSSDLLALRHKPGPMRWAFQVLPVPAEFRRAASGKLRSSVATSHCLRPQSSAHSGFP